VEVGGGAEGGLRRSAKQEGRREKRLKTTG
jgi:hypothetical protein